MRIKQTAILIVTILTGSPIFAREQLNIAVASNFRDPITAIATLYEEENPNTKINLIVGSSGTLFHQITKQAPYDLFFSADKNYPQTLYNDGYGIQAPKIYARGQLVIWSRKHTPDLQLEFLGEKHVKRIAIANPNLAPYGLAAKEVLTFNKLLDEINNKLVVAENIGQAAQFAATGNADAAFLAHSQVKSNALKNKGAYKVLPENTHAAIEQAYVIIEGKNIQAAAKFIRFLEEEKIQQLIHEYGYLTE